MGIFPGVSLGWHVDKEKFWSFMPENLMRLKLRASYGVMVIFQAWGIIRLKVVIV